MCVRVRERTRCDGASAPEKAVEPHLLTISTCRVQAQHARPVGVSIRAIFFSFFCAPYVGVGFSTALQQPLAGFSLGHCLQQGPLTRPRLEHETTRPMDVPPWLHASTQRTN